MTAPGAPPARVAGLLRRHASALALLVPLALVEVAVDGGLTLGYRHLIDAAILPANEHVLGTVIGALAVAVVASSVASVARDRAYARRLTAILGDVRAAIFDHVQRLSVATLSKLRAGEVVARFSTDLAGLESALAGAVGGIVLPSLGVFVGVVLLFAILRWPLAVGATLVWPLVLLGPRLVAPRAARAAYEKKEREAYLLVSIDEVVAAHRTIKAFDLRPFARDRFARRAADVAAATTRATFLGSLVERSAVVTIYVIQVAAVAVGSVLAYRREMSLGTLVSFLTIFWNLGWSVVVIGRNAPAIVAAWGSARRVDELLALRPDAAEEGSLPAFSALRRSIRVEGVAFAYDDQRAALEGATLEIRAGETVAVVGPSGSGKSTLLALIARFYDPSRGRVLFDDMDAREVSASSLRAQTGFVMQDPFLFDATIRENVRVGRLDATDAEVEEAARAAEIHDAVVAMPQGYDTPVGERGGALSTGQRQRVAIARALVRRPTLLLLDEASSALDPASEAAVNATLARAGRGRTTITVTHRLAGAASADRIFVMNAGRIVEEGAHGALLARGGLYADLWHKQSGFVFTGDGGQARVSRERLRAIALFRPLEDAQLDALARSLVTEHAVAGRRVVVEGQRGDLFYVIARGKVRVSRRAADGGDVELARLEDGDQFGELALLGDGPRNATVTCMTDCLFLSLTRPQFLDLIATTPRVREAIERVARERTAAARDTSLAATLH